jgi:hypothetical protein
MEVAFAKNFNDCVAVMAANSPHALVMDWWHRFDLRMDSRECFEAHIGRTVASRMGAEVGKRICKR